jgi:LmeA-like phospholipid-binding
VSRKTLFALLVLVLIVLAPVTILPSLLESVVARTLQDRFELRETPEVEIESSPAPMMYAGSFSNVIVSVEGLAFGGVQTKKVTMDLDPLNVNLADSLTSGALSTAKQPSGTLHVDLSEESALRLVQAGSGAPIYDIEFEPGQVVLRLGLGFGTATIVRGRLYLRDQLLIFEPQQVEEAPEFVTAEQVLAVTGFAYPATGEPFATTGLPFGVEVSGVKVRKDFVTLSGEVNDIPLAGAPAS